MPALALPALAMLPLVAAPTGAHAQDAGDGRQRLEQQLAQQQALNEALQARVARLEELLKGDVCADPAAAEALLNEPAPEAPPR
jgi:hypothetical protein